MAHDQDQEHLEAVHDQDQEHLNAAHDQDQEHLDAAHDQDQEHLDAAHMIKIKNILMRLIIKKKSWGAGGESQ